MQVFSISGPINMKLLVFLVASVALCAASTLPRDIPMDNSHYVEGESRYVWMADDNGKMHLVDLDEPVDTESLERRGSNNRYWLFTRQNRNSRQILTHNNAQSIRNSNYSRNRGIAVIVHGWNGSGNSDMNVAIRQAFLDAMDVNVIVVDWNGLANQNYIAAANGVPEVGRYLGNFLTWLIDNHGGNWNNVHLVGFSLGAHVVGNAGRTVGGRARRVTGLDPAGPRWGGNGNRLQSNSGRYVEAIHTDGRALGIMDRSGHADFYPNGGRHPQPGCGRGDLNTSCSHGRAPSLFASSVRRANRFEGKLCNNLRQAENNQCRGNILYMGNGNLGKSGNGIYGLTTGASWPF